MHFPGRPCKTRIRAESSHALTLVRRLRWARRATSEAGENKLAVGNSRQAGWPHIIIAPSRMICLWSTSNDGLLKMTS